MDRATRWFLSMLMVAAACGRAGDGAAAEGRTDSVPVAGRDTAEAREAVLRLEKELFQSYMRGDTAPAARILAEDYIGFSGDGHRETKTQAITNIRRDSTTAAAVTVDSIQVDSTIVRANGDAVVAQASGTIRAHEGRQSVTVGFRNTDVFVWRVGRWQIVATHLSKVPAPQGRSRTP